MRSVPRFPVLVLTLLAVLVAGHVRLSGQQPNPEPALKGLDPVALTGGKELPGDKALALERGGLRYLFATDANRKTFAREPARYEIQKNGQCAAMPGVQGDPSLFAVVKGRIYIFGSPDCRTAFTAEPEKYFQKRKNVAIFVHQDVELLDFAGPAEVFAAADHARAFNVYTVAAA
jgi:YHS domain-containing protein